MKRLFIVFVVAIVVILATTLISNENKSIAKDIQVVLERS
jgi:hypothetical protein